MYVKRCSGELCTQKSDGPQWVKWVHQFGGKSHCQECLMLDGCLFLKSKTPPWPHHPFCHCFLEPIAAAYIDYSKFDPYLFNTHCGYTHSKEKLFAQWGYTVADTRWLQVEMGRQAFEKYLSGDYILGKLDENG